MRHRYFTSNRNSVPVGGKTISLDEASRKPSKRKQKEVADDKPVPEPRKVLTGREKKEHDFQKWLEKQNKKQWRQGY
jgi:hypothetical protein